MKLDKLVIDRATWAFGKNDYINMLYNSSNHMKCCLGFFCNQAGVPWDELDDRGEPCEITKYEVPQLVNRDDEEAINTDLTGDAIQINDNPNISRKEREKRLTEMFAKHDIEVVFEGEYI